MTKLVMHIGTGKTGTTSIQKNLSKLDLDAESILYAGLYFENIQGGGGIDDFILDFYNDHDRFIRFTTDSLMKSLEFSKLNNVEQVVWVNESLYENPDLVFDAVKEASKLFDEVEIHCYLRRQDHWFKSAYQQWGIKHKTYGGKVRGFMQWVEESKSRVDYPLILNKWSDNFGRASLNISIYEKCSNVTSHFLNALGVVHNSGQSSKVLNKSLGKYQLSLFKLFNSFYKGGKLPVELDEFLVRSEVVDIDVPELNADVEFPTSEQLSHLLSQYDNDDLKKYSTETNLVDFSGVEPPKEEDGSINRDSLIGLLLFTIVKLEQRVNKLEQQE